MRSVVAVLVVAVCGLSLAACEDGPTSPCWFLEEPSLPDFSGRVAWADTTHVAARHLARIIIDDVHYPRWGDVNPRFPDIPLPDTVVVHITEKTARFIRQRDGSLWCTGSMLPVLADSVHVWHTGVELRSRPPQYFARRIEICVP
jgi:hypothetical protein